MDLPFDNIRTQLHQPGDGVFRDTDWLEQSRQRPEEFGRALLRYYAAGTHAPLKSNAKSGFDFYHDLVLRYLGSSSPALQWIDRETGLHSLTHAQLHAGCSRRQALWAAQGVRAGAALCIIAAMGPELLGFLLTGLRMGLMVSLLPPAGPDFLARRLRTLSGIRIAMASRYRMLLPDSKLADSVLAEDRSEANPAPVFEGSHTYEPDEKALALFSPLGEPQEEPIDVSAAAAYIGALRDGLLLLALQPGKVLAAPEHHLLQHQPALLLSTLLHGATFLQVRAPDFVRDSAGKLPVPIDVLMVSSALRDEMLKLPPVPLLGLKRWVVNPQEPQGQAAADWAHRFDLHNTPASALLLDGACGGSLLFSRCQRGSPPALLQPAPGVPFTLLRPDDSGEPARAGHGVWDPRPGSTGILLSPRDGGFIYSGTLAPTRHGRCYPVGEVESLAAALPFVLAASVVTPFGSGSEPVLLIFTGPEPLDIARALAPRRESALRAHIRARLGAEFTPAEILQYAMFPRCKGGVVDHDWCAHNHLRGSLRQREQHPLFRLLDRLRAACTRAYSAVEPASRPGADLGGL